MDREPKADFFKIRGSPLSDEKTTSQEPRSSHEDGVPGLPKIISFASLARCGEEVWIENEGKVYRLRRTRQGKLILTK